VVDRSPEFAFIVFPGIDWQSHYVDAEGPGAIESYRLVDRAVGKAAEKLRSRGAYDDTLIVVCSDHGHSPVDEHYDLPVRIDEDLGLQTAYHSTPALRVRDPEAVACVSGNGMCQVYLKGGRGWRTPPARDEIAALYPGLIDTLLAAPATDVVITRAREEGWLHVESRAGRARVRETPDRTAIEYERDDGADPLGLPELPARLSMQAALEATADTDHPDGLVQIAQLYRSARAGDVTVSALPGYDLRERYERPEHFSAHGSLHRAHMTTPLAVSAPVSEGPIRSVDVFATALDWLGRAKPPGIDGISRIVS
jgi:arylsulfatase A-like enzyme